MGYLSKITSYVHLKCMTHQRLTFKMFKRFGVNREKIEFKFSTCCVGKSTIMFLRPDPAKSRVCSSLLVDNKLNKAQNNSSTFSLRHLSTNGPRLENMSMLILEIKGLIYHFTAYDRTSEAVSCSRTCTICFTNFFSVSSSNLNLSVFSCVHRSDMAMYR